MRKAHILAFGLGCIATLSLSAQTFDFVSNLAIPDPLFSGITDTRTISTPTTAIGDLNVRLVISGDAFAANGDYFATLTHGSGFSVLLNRVGRRSGGSLGYPDNGFDVVLDDQAPNGDIHVYRLTLFGDHSTPLDVAYESPLSGRWAPDGRDASFSSVTDLSPRATSPLASFNGLDPNGAWTLFIADVSAGGAGTLVGWSLEITPVPEPAESAVVMAALIAGSSFALRRVRGSRTLPIAGNS